MCGYLVKAFRTENPPIRNIVATQLALIFRPDFRSTVLHNAHKSLRKQIIQFVVDVSLTAFCRRYEKSSSTLSWCKSTLYEEVRKQKWKCTYRRLSKPTFTFMWNWKSLFVVSGRNALMSPHYAATYMTYHAERTSSLVRVILGSNL